MVTLTRLTGAQFALNPDLIERVDCTPDTVITLVDGTKYIVLESLADVVSAIRDYRAAVIGAASSFEHGAEGPAGVGRRSRLVAVPAENHDNHDVHDARDARDAQDARDARDAQDTDGTRAPAEGPVVPLAPRSR